MTAIINNACPIDAYDNAAQAREILNWIEAINWAAVKALKDDQAWRAQHLAGLSQYLSGEWAGHFDNIAREINDKHELGAKQ